MSVQGEPIYLDNNATTRLAPECADVMLACLREVYGNPSSKHAFGARARRLVEEARRQVAQLLGALPSEIIFTSGGTESNQLAIHAALALHPDKRRIVTSGIEHPSTLLLLKQLEKHGICVTYLPVDGCGRLDLAALEDALTPDVALVTLMWANNETGVLFPVREAARIAQARGVPFHTDAVQAAGKRAIDLARVHADLVSLSGHKLHGPKGVGALYVRKGFKLAPLFPGHQERGRRGGTENVPGIVGLGVACALAAESLESEEKRLAGLRARFEEGVLARMPWVRINGAPAERVANTSNISFGELNGEMIIDRLDREGLCASLGAACTAGGTEPSHVLTAMGLTPGAAAASVRFSLSRYTTAGEIERALELLASVVLPLAAAAA